MKTEESPQKPTQKTSSAMSSMFNNVAQRYDLANRVMSLGRDIFWRSALARRLKIIDAPGNTLDLASGTGDQVIEIKKNFPAMNISGIDISSEMMELANPKFANLPAPTPIILEGDALNTPFEANSFDNISISFGLRNIPPRKKLYEEVLRVLKPGGRFLILEMYHDRETLTAPFINFYLKKIVPFLGGQIVSREKSAYQYLISSIMAFPQPEKIIDEMNEVGFENLNYKSYTLNTVMLVWGEKQ